MLWKSKQYSKGRNLLLKKCWFKSCFNLQNCFYLQRGRKKGENTLQLLGIKIQVSETQTSPEGEALEKNHGKWGTQWACNVKGKKGRNNRKCSCSSRSTAKTWDLTMWRRNKWLYGRISWELEGLKVARWQCWCLEGNLQEGWLGWEGAIPMVEEHRHDEPRKGELNKMERIKWNGSRGQCWVPAVGMCVLLQPSSGREHGHAWGRAHSPAVQGCTGSWTRLCCSTLPLSQCHCHSAIVTALLSAQTSLDPPQAWGNSFPHRGCLYPKQHIWSFKKNPK